MRHSLVARHVVVYDESPEGVRVAMMSACAGLTVPIPYDRFKQLMHDPSVTEIEFETAD